MKETSKFLISKLDSTKDTVINIEELELILNALSSFVESNNEENEICTFFKQEYKIFSLTIDCIIFWNLSLNQILFTTTPEFNTKENKQISNLGYFNFLLIQLTNNLIGMKYLLEKGLDTQAKALYRNSIEISDLGIACLFDEEYFENHRTPNEKKPGNPFISPKNFSVAQKADKVLDQLYEEELKSSENNVSIKPIMFKIRHEQYNILSESTHGNYLHNFLNAYKMTGEDNYVPSIGGGTWKNMEYPLSDICLHLIGFKRHTAWILKSKHDIDLFDNSSIQAKLIYYIDCIVGENFLEDLLTPYKHNDLT